MDGVFRAYKKGTPRKDDKWTIHGFIFDLFYIYVRNIHLATHGRLLEHKICGAATVGKLPPMVLQIRVDQIIFMFWVLWPAGNNMTTRDQNALNVIRGQKVFWCFSSRTHIQYFTSFLTRDCYWKRFSSIWVKHTTLHWAQWWGEAEAEAEAESQGRQSIRRSRKQTRHKVTSAR